MTHRSSRDSEPGIEGSAADASTLFPIIYNELRAIAGHLLKGAGSDTLQPTALVHEAYMKLAGYPLPDWSRRAHVLAIAARAMRQVIVDAARRRGADKRGGQWRQVMLDQVAQPQVIPAVDIMALDQALTKLASLNERQSRVAELRFLGGLSVEETAHVLGVSQRTVKLDWRMARAWLNSELRRDSAAGGRS